MGYKVYFARELHGEDYKHYSKNGIEFDYITPKQFKKLDNSLVIGSVKLKEIDKDDCNKLIVSNEKDHAFEIVKTKKNVMGYIEVEPNIYVSVIDNKILFIILFIILLLAIGLLLFSALRTDNVDDEPQNNIEIEQGEDITYEENEDEAVQEYIDVPGYANLLITSSDPEVSLINPEGNTVYMQYIIMEGDMVLYETGAIEPNKMVKVDFKSFLSVGEHKLTFVINTFDIDTQESCNGATQEVAVFVE